MTVVNNLNIGKKFILSNTSWFGGRNLFLPILYIVVGGICIVGGLIFLFLFWNMQRLERNQIRSTSHLITQSIINNNNDNNNNINATPNYQTMMNTISNNNNNNNNNMNEGLPITGTTITTTVVSETI